MQRAWLAVVLVSAACASAPIRKADQATVLTADARVLEGCYSCLVEARDIYQRLAVDRARSLLITRLFETHVLIGLREQELALDPTESFRAAEGLMPELSATYDAARYLEVARAIPPDHIGATRAERNGLYRRTPTPALLNEFTTNLEAGEGSAPFRAYLTASLECLREFAGRRAGGLTDVPADAPPLVRYRMGTCPTVRQYELDTVVEAVPAFVEARLFRARVPVLNWTSQYTKDLREALNQALERFPRSPAVTYGLGALNQTVGDCKAAIRYNEDTIALSPLHEDAALQRVICLGHIGQFVPAIEGATRIIERRYYNVGDAYYWRAWSQYKRGALSEARTDIDAARAVAVNLKVFTLGGMIKYDQKELDLAEADLRSAIKMDVYNQTCIARWYYGLVGFAREDWPETADRFADAGTCYRNAANSSRRDLEAMRTADVDETFRATQIAGFEAVIKEDTDQEQASYLNTANCHARAGDIAKAREWLDRIPAESVHALVAAELRKQIGGGA